jgi:hypothetical protein
MERSGPRDPTTPSQIGDLLRPQAIDVLVQEMLSWGMLRSLACYAHIVMLGRLGIGIDRQPGRILRPIFPLPTFDINTSPARWNVRVRTTITENVR